MSKTLHPALINHIHEQYKLLPGYDQSSIQAFVSFASEWLKKHPPIGVAYLDNGLGVRLNDGTLLSFADDAEGQLPTTPTYHITQFSQSNLPTAPVYGI